MYPKPIRKLVELFSQFPGIGPRQAARFVFFLLKENGMALNLTAALEELEGKVKFCQQCFRTVETETIGATLCGICRNPKRDGTQIAVVEKESDLHNLEKTGAYQGHYHVLSGLISPLDEDSSRPLHLAELRERVKIILGKGGRCELILATNPTTEGDTTALYIERVLDPLKKNFAGLVISRLGRGLSLGSELEYADEITLKNALINRK